MQTARAVALAVHGASPVYNTACTLYCPDQQQCVLAVWVRFTAESGAGGCYSTVTATASTKEN